MIDRQLERTKDDRSLYVLDGVGTLRLEGAFGSRATAEAGTRRWTIARRGFWRELQATDVAGTIVGTFGRRLIRSNVVTWNGREYKLGRASVWRERYSLADGDREIAVLDCKGWGRQPVKLSTEEDVDPGLLLFAAFAVQTLAADSSAGASAGAVAATG
jgi:hypothetical protein